MFNHEIFEKSKYSEIIKNFNKLNDVDILTLFNIMDGNSHTSFYAKKQARAKLKTGGRYIVYDPEAMDLEDLKMAYKTELLNNISPEQYKYKIGLLSEHLRYKLKMGPNYYGLTLAVILKNGFIIDNLFNDLELEQDARDLIKAYIDSSTKLINDTYESICKLLQSTNIDYTKSKFYNIAWLLSDTRPVEYKSELYNVLAIHNKTNPDNQVDMNVINSIADDLLALIKILKHESNGFKSRTKEELLELFSNSPYKFTPNLWKTHMTNYINQINDIFEVNINEYLN